MHFCEHDSNVKIASTSKDDTNQESKGTQMSYDIGGIFYSKCLQKSKFNLFIICHEIIPCYENQFAIPHCKKFLSISFSRIQPSHVY